MKLTDLKQIPIHPAARLAPMTSAAQLAAIENDIKANGILEPIVLAKIGDTRGSKSVCVLDGRTRLHIAAKLSLKTDIPVREIDLRNDGEALAHVKSLNAHRRHLSDEQRAALIKAELKGDPTQSDRTIAKRTGTSPTTVGKVRSGVRGGHVPARRGADGKLYKKTPWRICAKPVGLDLASMIKNVNGALASQVEDAVIVSERKSKSPPANTLHGNDQAARELSELITELTEAAVRLRDPSYAALYGEEMRDICGELVELCTRLRALAGRPISTECNLIRSEPAQVAT